MAREVDYSKQIEKEKSLTKENVMKKLNREDISTEEMAVLLDGPEYTFTDRTVRNYLVKLCERYKELNIEDFKEGRSYKLKASWNGILAVLLRITSLPPYDGRTDKMTLEDYLRNLDIIIASIDKEDRLSDTNVYLSDSDKKLVKSHSTYQQALLEKNMYESVLNLLNRIFYQLSIMPSNLRFQTLAGLYEDLENVPINLAQKHASYLIERSEYKKESKVYDENSVNDTSFKDNLEAYLVSLLALRLQGKEGYIQSMNIEVAGSTLLEQLILGRMTTTEHDGLMKIANKTRKDLLEQTQVKETFDKVSAVLDPEIPLERNLLTWIEETLLMFTFKSNNEDTNYELALELMRQAVTGHVKTKNRDSDVVNYEIVP